MNPGQPDINHIPVENPDAGCCRTQAQIPLHSPLLSSSGDGYLETDDLPRLRNFHPEVVIFRPEIPQNTGSIARLCAAMGTHLHLIRPMKFQITEKQIRRAGLDYWCAVSLAIHDSWEDFLAIRSDRRFIFIETGSTRPPSVIKYCPGDVLVLGGENGGIPASIIEQTAAQTEAHHIAIPMFNRRVRSLNLANTASIVLYQAIAQLHGWSNC